MKFSVKIGIHIVCSNIIFICLLVNCAYAQQEIAPSKEEAAKQAAISWLTFTDANMYI